MRVEHAILMAAGVSSRFAPLSYEQPKGLLRVRGEVLIERQIRQLLEAGVRNLILVTGYQAEKFAYLEKQFPLVMLHNEAFATRNNNGSLYVARDYLENAYICSVDNYFVVNPFSAEEESAYYAVVRAQGETDEWCVVTDPTGRITEIEIGGRDALYMLGHAFFDEAFAKRFREILLQHYEDPSYRPLLWEGIYKEHLSELSMKAREYPADAIFEFDSLDELRTFDTSYIRDSRSNILKKIVTQLEAAEAEIVALSVLYNAQNESSGFRFRLREQRYKYLYKEGIARIDESE